MILSDVYQFFVSDQNAPIPNFGSNSEQNPNMFFQNVLHLSFHITFGPDIIWIKLWHILFRIWIRVGMRKVKVWSVPESESEKIFRIRKTHKLKLSKGTSKQLFNTDLNVLGFVDWPEEAEISILDRLIKKFIYQPKS